MVSFAFFSLHIVFWFDEWKLFAFNLIFVSFILVMTTSTPEKADGLKALENAIERIRETITKLGGVFTVNMAVSVLSTKTDFIEFPIANC